MAALRTAFRPAAKSIITPARVAAFRTSTPLRIGAAGPQVIQGTVNDPAPIPPVSRSHGSYHWDFERLVSVALVPLTLAPFVAGSVSPVMDAVLCSALVIHSHIGFDACVTDYIPERKYKKLAPLATWALRGATATVLYGLYQFETNDVGLVEGIKKVWTA
ncbi:membrane anchor subunit of succinate dehydrogenase, Sdh4 [Saitoella coloradoensis]